MLTNLSKHKTYLLACSFGPDSMALFDMLVKKKIKFAVAHVNYKMRGIASDAAEANLRSHSIKHEVPFYGLAIEGSKLSGNFQAKAREVRYEFFTELAKERGFAAILTAHNEDDHLETYLMQKNSKKMSFYYGISPEMLYKGVKVARPLLRLTKKELQHYCENNYVPYEIDESNEMLLYTRNKVRHQIVKRLSDAERKILLQEINSRNEIIRKDKAIVENVIASDKVLLTDYFELTPVQQQLMVYLFFEKQAIAQKYTKGKFGNIHDALLKKSQSLMFKVHGDVYFVKAYKYFTFVNINNYSSYEILVKKPMTIATKHFTARLNSAEALNKFSNALYPLTISNAKKGDMYKIKHYEKQLNRMFIDMKMPRHLRLIWPIIRSKKGEIVYVPRYRYGYKQRENDVFIIKS